MRTHRSQYVCRRFSTGTARRKIRRSRCRSYGNAPLTALVELDSHIISDVKVTVHGKGEKGVPVTYTVGKESLETYDGIPIFGLYQKFANNVTVEYKENGKAMKDDYVVQTSAIVNHYMDNRSISDLQQTKVIKVAPI